MSRLALVPAVAALLLAGCPKLGDLGGYQPTLRYERVKITGASFEGAEADFVFALHNPNPVAVKLASFAYDLDIGGADFAKGDQDEGVAVVANGDTELVLPMAVKFADLIELAGVADGVDSVPFEISGTFGFATPVGVVELPYEESGELPVLRPPKVRVVGLRVAEFKPLQNVARLELDLGLTHRQGASLGFQDFDYEIGLGGRKAATGEVADAGTVEAGKETTLTLPLNLDLVSLGSTVVTAITNKDPIEVDLDGAMKVTTPLGAIPFTVDQTKTVEIR